MADLSLLADAPLFSIFIGIISVLAVAISKAGFGSAFGSLAAPIMLFAFEPAIALGILLPLFLLTDIWLVWTWRHVGVRRIIIVMTICAVIGQICGWAVLRFGAMDDGLLVLFISVMAILTSLRYFIDMISKNTKGLYVREMIRVYRKRIVSRAIFWCGLSGFSSFVSLTGGIPAQIYMLPLGLPRQLFVASMAWYFLFINLAKIPFFTDLDFISAQSLTVSLILMPMVPIGIAIGRWLNHIMSDKLFYLTAHCLLLILGVQLFMRFVRGG